jgi:hypothetical protein
MTPTIGALNLTLLELREKLRRGESLTLPEQRWLAWTYVDTVTRLSHEDTHATR